MFNIMGKNVVGEKADEMRQTSRKRASEKVTDVERKVTKLRSQTLLQRINPPKRVGVRTAKFYKHNFFEGGESLNITFYFST